MQVILADRNPDTRLTNKLLFQNISLKSSIIEITNAIELIKCFMSSQSSIIFLDEQFLGNNTVLLVRQLKEINSKLHLVWIGSRDEIGDQTLKSLVNHRVIKEDSTNKKVKIIQEVINDYSKSRS